MLIDTNGFEIGDEVFVIKPIGNGNGGFKYVYNR